MVFYAQLAILVVTTEARSTGGCTEAFGAFNFALSSWRGNQTMAFQVQNNFSVLPCATAPPWFIVLPKGVSLYSILRIPGVVSSPTTQ